MSMLPLLNRSTSGRDLASAVSRVLTWLGVQDEGMTSAVHALAEESA
ncbi:MAG TPA: hypothetical protein VLR88_02725 [Propionibacteriaceae bacterium]|nr:hypothetical protein [Propionibacteriaceae bacterium]